MIFGETHLRLLIANYNDHYHHFRPHQGLDNVTPSGPSPPPERDVEPDEVECHERLGGLLKTYYRRAA